VRFANALKTPNWYEPGLAQCFIPRIAVSFLTYGGFIVGDYYGDTPPKCIMFWGHNPLISNADGELGINARRALDKGTIGIAIDPRKSETAKKCDIWLPLRPGTDDALALAMIHVLINENLYDKKFVEEWTTGFDRLKKHVASFTPEWAEKITWIPASRIVEAARTYATNKPSILEWGLAIEQNNNSLQTVRAIAILRALTGNIDIPGGDILGMNIMRSYPSLRFRLPGEMIRKRLGGDQYKLLGGNLAFMPSAHIPTLFKAMRTGDPYSVRALLIFGNNPLSTLANAREVYESLKNLELLTVTDLFMTPTAAMADYVLPASYWPELEEVIGYPLVVENVVMAQKKVVQIGQCRQDEWIINEISKRLDLPESDKTLEDIMNYQLDPLGVTYEELKQRNFINPPLRYEKYKENGFRTRSGKVELYSEGLKKMGYDPLPGYREPFESPVSTPELLQKFPYVLTTGSRRAEFFHSEHRQIHALRRLRPDPRVDIHSETAKKHGIGQDDWVVISSPRGSIRMMANLSEDIHPQVINVEHGWWFPEKSGPDYGVWESNANILTSNEGPYDPAFGTYHLRGLLCRIEKEAE
jgi:thiosulfate reductase/polysulfide reductase chain A